MHRPIARVALLLVGLLAAPAVPVSASSLVATSTTASVPASPVALYAPIDLGAAVSPSPGAGWVNFWVDGYLRANGEVGPDGTATATLPNGLPEGTHEIVARFLGTDTHASSVSSALTVTVVDMRTPVSVSLSTTPNPSLRGDPVDFSVAVSPNPGSGEVRIYNAGSSTLTSATLASDGTARFSYAFSATWNYQLTACFDGNADFGPACSSVVDQAVTSYPSTTVLTIEPSVIYPDESITFGVTISPAPETPVSAWIGRNEYDRAVFVPIDPATGTGEVTIANDVGRERFPMGTTNLRAFFGGTNHVDPSSSGIVQLTVRLDDATLDVSTSPGPVTVGDPLTFSASVSPAPTEPTAGVGFLVNGPAGSGFGDLIRVELNDAGTGQTVIDTDGWPAGDYWYDASCCSDPHLKPVTVRGYFTLVDVEAPVGSLAVAAGTDVVITRTISVNVPATDGAGSGVTTVALSNDGETWSETTYASAVTWQLAPGDGPRTVFAKWRDQAGNWSPVAADSVTLTSSAASVSGPIARLHSTPLISGRPEARVSWSADPQAAGLVTYRLELSTNGGPWVLEAAALSGMSTASDLAVGRTYRFRIRAVDQAGNAGPWAYGPTFRLSGISQSSATVRYAGTWATSTSSIWWGGTARSSSRAGSTASYTFTGRSIAWVGLKGVGRGKAAVYVNGVYKATVDLYSATTKKQLIVWSANYATSATRTVTIKVLGTAGRPRVDVDGFIVGS